jgi:hypothetical protein
LLKGEIASQSKADTHRAEAWDWDLKAAKGECLNHLVCCDMTLALGFVV